MSPRTRLILAVVLVVASGLAVALSEVPQVRLSAGAWWTLGTLVMAVALLVWGWAGRAP